LTRGVTLAEQSASGTVGDNERGTINTEYQQILQEIDRVVEVANFKGEALFNTTGAVTKAIYVGDTQIQSFITVSIAGSRGAGTAALGMEESSVATSEESLTALDQLKTAISSVSRWRGALGAQQNRLTNSVGIIQVQAQNLMAAESAIMDANMAEEIVNMTKFQILLQSGMSSLSQANASSQLVLSLLR
jgi:flagellin